MRRFVITLLILLGIYFIWSFYGRGATPPTNYKPFTDIRHVNTRRGSTNIIAIQPFMSPRDYSGATAFANKLDFYLTHLAEQGLISSNTTVVLPEHFGTWLVAAEEKQSVYNTDHIDPAIRLVALSNIFQFAYYYFRSETSNRERETIFRMKGSKMATIYSFTLSKAAQKFNIHIVGGSIVLPNPDIVDGKLMLNDGPLKNVSMVFGPDGSILSPLYAKTHPSTTEREFIHASTEPLSSYLLPFGKASILIGEDAWHQEAYDQLQKEQVGVVVSPSFLLGSEVWADKWQGIDPMPDDIPSKEVNTLTERDAWYKYSARRIDGGVGLVVFLRGNLWNLGTQGQSFGFANNRITKTTAAEGPKALVAWY